MMLGEICVMKKRGKGPQAKGMKQDMEKQPKEDDMDLEETSEDEESHQQGEMENGEENYGDDVNEGDSPISDLNSQPNEKEENPEGGSNNSECNRVCK